ncbi:MAG TPA: ABC transporter substrate-binding protein [Parachlamydiales bacterium]|nr:ABC transporter substrate-binding protein [Parachlamydiales bacterium]
MRSWCSAIFFLFSIILCVFFITGCSQSERVQRFRSWMEPNGKIKILSTITQIGDLVEEIGGDRIDSWVLMHGELDPHSYELVKGDDEKFTKADIVFFNGLGLEHGASLNATLKRHPCGVNLGKWIEKIFPQKILKKNQLTDPHIWMDVSLWKETIDPILENLIAHDPEGKEFYEERAARLKERMDFLHQEMKDCLQKVPSNKRYLVTSHDAFHYFTKTYLADPSDGEAWTERFAAPEGLAPDGQLNPRDIEAIIDYLREKKIAVLFPESNVSRDSIKKIVSAGRELGLHISICSEALYGDAMGAGQNKSYFDSMRHNAEVISRYLEE